MAIVPWVYNNPRIDHNKSYVNFIFANKQITMWQDLNVEVSVARNTAFRLWDGAFLLAKYLENVEIFPSNYWCTKRCVELGAGCGLVGIVAWMLGADVVLTDLSDALTHTRMCLDNVKRQLVGQGGLVDGSCERIILKEYKWGDEIPCQFKGVDFIFGSDIVYHPSTVDELVDSISRVKTGCNKVLLSYKPRALGEQIFFDKILSKGLNYSLVPEQFHPKEFLNSLYQIIEI